MSGLILFRHRLMLYRAGLSLANTTQSIVASLHGPEWDGNVRGEVEEDVEDKEEEEEEEGKRPLQGPVDIMEIPVDVGQMQETFNMPINVSRLTQSGVYVDSSRLRGNANDKRTDEKIMIPMPDGEEPFEATLSTFTW